MRSRNERPGMTVLELVVAISILGLLIAIAGSVLGAIVAGGRGVERETARNDESGAATNALRVLLASARVDGGRAVFEGDSRAARFQSFCPDAAGDLRRCVVTLETDGRSQRGAARIAQWTAVAVRVTVAAHSLAYLANEEQQQWYADWEATDRPPAAIAAVSGRDTVLLRVGRP